MYKYKGLNRGYINYHFISISDLELFFVRFSLKVPLLSSLNFIGIVM